MSRRRANDLRYCVGGRWAGNGEYTDPCTIRYQHAAECETYRSEARTILAKEGATPDDLSPEQRRALNNCRGCLPREATSGWLCDHCHRYLQQWLGDGTPNSLLWAWRWLRTQYAPVQSSAGRQDWERSGTRDDLPSALREAVLDCRTLMQDRIFVADERAHQVLGGTALADLPAFEMAEGVAFLRNHLLSIEDHRELVAPLFCRVQDSMIDAHRLAPWRATAEKVRGNDGPIPCPHCERKTLTVFGGDDFVTCRSCHATIHRGRFDQWTAMIESEVKA